MDKRLNPEGTPISRIYRYVPLERVEFSNTLLWDRVQKLMLFGLYRGTICKETYQGYEEFILDS